MDLKAEFAEHYPHPVFGCECMPTDEKDGTTKRLDGSWEGHMAQIAHILIVHEATLHLPGKPDGVAIGGTDEDLHLVHSIYFPNCQEM